jgi:hypothetical protein
MQLEIKEEGESEEEEDSEITKMEEGSSLLVTGK